MRYKMHLCELCKLRNIVLFIYSYNVQWYICVYIAITNSDISVMFYSANFYLYWPIHCILTYPDTFLHSQTYIVIFSTVCFPVCFLLFHKCFQKPHDGLAQNEIRGSPLRGDYCGYEISASVVYLQLSTICYNNLLPKLQRIFTATNS